MDGSRAGDEPARRGGKPADRLVPQPVRARGGDGSTARDHRQGRTVAGADSRDRSGRAHPDGGRVDVGPDVGRQEHRLAGRGGLGSRSGARGRHRRRLEGRNRVAGGIFALRRWDRHPHNAGRGDIGRWGMVAGSGHLRLRQGPRPAAFLRRQRGAAVEADGERSKHPRHPGRGDETDGSGRTETAAGPRAGERHGGPGPDPARGSPGNACADQGLPPTRPRRPTRVGPARSTAASTSNS